MGKRSQGKARWATRLRTEHPGPRLPVESEGYVLDCGDCGQTWHFATLHEAHVGAKDHLCDAPKHETYLSVHRFDEFGGVEVEDVDLWEDVATWGPSVGLEVITKERYEELKKSS